MSLSEQSGRLFMNSSAEKLQRLENYKGFAAVYEYVPALSRSPNRPKPWERCWLAKLPLGCREGGKSPLAHLFLAFALLSPPRNRFYIWEFCSVTFQCGTGSDCCGRSLCHLRMHALCRFNKPHIRESSVDSPQFLAGIEGSSQLAT